MIFSLWLINAYVIGYWISTLVIEFKNKPKKQKYMTSKAALAHALLQGKIVNIKNGFNLFGITNIPREIGRSIEREKDGGFGVIVSRTPCTGKSRYGQPVNWVDYKLNKTADCNVSGARKMQEYVNKEIAKSI